MPRPRELEVTVLAYAPHFLGLAAAAAVEKLKRSSAVRLAAAAADGGGGGGNPDSLTITATGGDSNPTPTPASAPVVLSNTVRQDRSTKRESPPKVGGEGSGRPASVPTGLSPSAVWPDEEAGRKRIDVGKHRADPVRVRSVMLAMAMLLHVVGWLHILHLELGWVGVSLPVVRGRGWCSAVK